MTTCTDPNQDAVKTFMNAGKTMLNPTSFKSFADTSVQEEVVLFLAFKIVFLFLVGLVTGNYSQVDKMWSLSPWLYVGMYFYDTPRDPRLALMFVSAFFWGIRLTLNFNRRGGYTWPPWLGEEDYRWAHIRKQYKADEYPVLFQVFHFVAICAWQLVILFLIAAPAQVVHYYGTCRPGGPAPLQPLDWVATLLIIGLVCFEAQADNEQFEFQEIKYGYLRAGVRPADLPFPYSVGFLTSGLFALSRHPNYFAEQSIWVVFNLYVFAAAGG